MITIYCEHKPKRILVNISDTKHLEITNTKLSESYRNINDKHISANGSSNLYCPIFKANLPKKYQISIIFS